jgi:peptidoglycan/LPS O-acetylase OafA/YrhL
MTASTAARDESRLTSLDGLRGLAALVVVLHHLSLTLKPFSDVWIVPTAQHPPTGSLVWWFTSTPLELLIAGPEAVLVFFVLSGLVLTLPVLRKGAGFDWVAYFPQRVVRLYLPAIASVVLSAIWIIATSWSSGRSTSLWVQAYRFTGFDWAKTLSSMDLLFGDNSLNNVLWTLRWEVLFSLVLPIAVVLVVRRRWALTVIVLTALILIGEYAGSGILQYLPVFLFGVLIAVHHEGILSWTRDDRNRLRVRWGGLILLVVSLLLLDIHWTAWGALGGPPHLQLALLGIQPLGAAGIVLAAAYWPPFRAVLQSGFFRWLGRISFSVYLVHVPIIIALDGIFGSWSPPVRLLVSLIVALGIAELFSRFVEQPSHRLAKRVGLASSALLQRERVS